MILLILILVYIISFYGTYKHIQISHYHKNGTNYGSTPNDIDFFFAVIPFLNSLSLLISWMFNSPLKNKQRIKYENFFKPKNHESNS